MPVQVITVINQALVRRWALARVENAVVAQSLQLRPAWGTSCVEFGPGGWPLYLKVGDTHGESHGEHFYYGMPYALVWTSGSPWPAWSMVFSHEIAEMLVDPTTARGVWRDGVRYSVEVADRVENQAYLLDGVYVTDFVLPSWYAGATDGDPVCVETTCSFPGPLIAPADAPSPYDEMRVLIAPWMESAAR